MDEIMKVLVGIGVQFLGAAGSVCALRVRTYAFAKYLTEYLYYSTSRNRYLE